MSSVRKWITVAVFAAVAAVPAVAQPTIGGGWATKFFGGLGVFGTFSLTSANPFEIRAVDGYVVGDRFRISWTGTTSGSFDTSVPGTTGTGCSDGDSCWFGGGDYTRGSGIITSGAYSFDLELIAAAPGTTGGAMFIRADETAVPEPSTWLLMGTGLAGVLGFSRRRRA